MAAIGSEFVKLQQLKTAIDSKQPDMTGVVKVVTGQGSTPYLTTGGDAVPAVALTNTIPDSGEPESYAMIHTGIGYALSTFFGSGDAVNAGIGVSGGTAILTMNNKSAYSMTDAISDSPTGNALVTDKAVADYVKSLVATDEEFDSVFGL